MPAAVMRHVRASEIVSAPSTLTEEAAAPLTHAAKAAAIRFLAERVGVENAKRRDAAARKAGTPPASDRGITVHSGNPSHASDRSATTTPCARTESKEKPMKPCTCKSTTGWSALGAVPPPPDFRAAIRASRGVTDDTPPPPKAADFVLTDAPAPPPPSFAAACRARRGGAA